MLILYVFPFSHPQWVGFQSHGNKKIKSFPWSPQQILWMSYGPELWHMVGYFQFEGRLGKHMFWFCRLYNEGKLAQHSVHVKCCYDDDGDNPPCVLLKSQVIRYLTFHTSWSTFTYLCKEFFDGYCCSCLFRSSLMALASGTVDSALPLSSNVTHTILGLPAQAPGCWPHPKGASLILRAPARSRGPWSRGLRVPAQAWGHDFLSFPPSLTLFPFQKKKKNPLMFDPRKDSIVQAFTLTWPSSRPVAYKTSLDHPEPQQLLTALNS